MRFLRLSVSLISDSDFVVRRLNMDTQSLVKQGRRIKLKSTQLFIIAGTVLMTMVISIMCIGLTVHYEVSTDTADTESVAYWKEHMSAEQEIWFDKGAEELRIATKSEKFKQKLKNVIIFMANGVSTDMLARARFREANKITNFVWDKFPYVGALRTQCGVFAPCDLGTLGTSLFGGVKTTPGLLALDKRVDSEENCLQAVNETFHIHSIFNFAHKSQLRTGFITSQRVTGPLLSSLYAHASATKWECDAAIPKHLQTDCIDVATQLMLGNAGQSINVIMGGGKQTLVSRLSNDTEVDPLACDSKDKRNLLQDWKYLKLESNVKFDLLETQKDLDKFNGTKRDFVLGVFSNKNLQKDEVKFQTMVMKALDVLTRNSSGFIAVVETAVERTEHAEDFQKSLIELDDIIKSTRDHKGFSPQTTLILVAFMNLLPSANETTVAPADIRLYVAGPNAHLFHRVHEETYLAHAISYSLKIGPFSSRRNKKP